MQQNAVTLIVAGLGIVGTLGGIVVGHILTRSWSRREWVRDRRNEEFRELITIVVEAFGTIGDPFLALGPETPETTRKVNDASAKCACAFMDRIYIARDVKEMDLLTQWFDALAEFNKTKNPERWGTAMKGMTKQIVDAATRPSI